MTYQENMTKNKWILVVIVSLLSFVIFFLLRVPNLNIIPVFVDEAIYIRWSQVMRSEPSLRFLPMSDGKQPLFMWATIPFFKVFSDPVIAARSLSLAAGFGSMVGIVFLSTVLFSNPVISALSALIYAVLPFSVFFDRMALADSMLAMFGVWSLALGILFAKTQKLDYAMFLGFVLGGALLTKSPAIMFYGWLFVAIIFFFRAKEDLWKSLAGLFLGLFFTIAISQAIYSVLRLGPNFQMLGSRNQDYLYTFKEVLSHPLSPFVGNIKSTANWLWLLLTPSALVLYCLAWLNKKDRRQIIFLTLVSLLPLISQASIAKVYTSRYILFATYPLVPLFGLGLFWLITRRGFLLRLSSVVLVLIPTIISVFYIAKPEQAPMSYDMRSGYLEEWTAGTGQKETSEYLVELAKQGKKIVVFTEGFFGTLPDGIQIYTQGYPDITVVGSTYYVTTLPEGLTNTSPENLGFFIVNKSRNHLGQADLSKLELIKEFPKAVRLDGTREVLQFYKYIF
jgi:4-amino-4-deoxy-L-arabinose transferase-like glycosyltransferase